MNLRLACAGLLGVVFALPASAGILGGKKKLPTPISYVTKRVDRSDRIGGVIKHPPAKYTKPGWGSLLPAVRDNYPSRPLMPHLQRQDR